MIWTPEAVEKLRALWADGLSSSQIAAQFGGVTRNTIIGKAHRLKLPGRQVPSSLQNRANGAKARKRKPRLSGWKRHPKPKPEPGVAPMPPLDAPVSLNLSLMDLDYRQCRYPHGDGPYRFCGYPTAEFESYCEFHKQLCYTPIDKRRQRSLFRFYM